MMRFKIDPEVIRFVQGITAAVQGMAAVLTGTDAISKNALVWIVAVGAMLQGFSAFYMQGVNTNPPAGMLTEERAKELSEPDESTPDAPMPAPEGRTFASGRASVAPEGDLR